MRVGRTLVLLALMGVFLLPPCASGRAVSAASAVSPGTIRTDATFEHIGVLWWIEGDSDLDSTMALEFRRLGEGVWRPGAPSMRAYPTIRVQDGPLGLNYWAASALFLESGETYELRLTLTDPDGGGETRTIAASTRTQPQPDQGGRQLYVIPGAGGGVGTYDDPFRGLQAAADAAQPGDDERLLRAPAFETCEEHVEGSEEFLAPSEGGRSRPGVGRVRVLAGIHMASLIRLS